MCSMSLTEQLKAEIQAADLDVIGISSAEPFQVSGDREECIDPREIMPAARAIIIAGFCTFYPPNLVQSQPVLPRGSFPPYGSRVFNPMTSYCQQVIKQLLAKKDFQAVTSMRIPVKLAAMRAGLGAYGKVDKAKCITNWLWGAFAPPALWEKQENRLFGCGALPSRSWPVAKQSVATRLSLWATSAIPRASKRSALRCVRRAQGTDHIPPGRWGKSAETVRAPSFWQLWRKNRMQTSCPRSRLP